MSELHIQTINCKYILADSAEDLEKAIANHIGALANSESKNMIIRNHMAVIIPYSIDLPKEKDHHFDVKMRFASLTNVSEEYLYKKVEQLYCLPHSERLPIANEIYEYLLNFGVPSDIAKRHMRSIGIAYSLVLRVSLPVQQKLKSETPEQKQQEHSCNDGK